MRSAWLFSQKKALRYYFLILTRRDTMKKLVAKIYGALSDERKALLNDLGLLFLRVTVAGVMLVSHGWGKLMSFGEKYAMFPDPLGVSSPVSMALAVGAEVFCSAAIILGLGTRLAAIPLAFTMVIAMFVIHADDPWQKKEFAFMYLLPFLTLVCTGAGRFSLDAILARRCKE
jgi:putative oxidoreductase